jgi:trafficking protein particle complex subunit 9
LTFEDSTIASAQQALTEGELSVFEAYETEYSLIHQNVFSWDGKKEKLELPSGKKIAVTVDCFGKVGW